ncbi:MAG: MazG family protein [Clostridia bacterium]|nr:MazG family protein [Clostridia bacterium]
MMNESAIKNVKERLVSERRHDFESLRLLVEVLRSEEGCAWDRIQTHSSIRSDIIEETYEVVEAIDKEDPDLLREELGDVLFQVMFHSRIEEEASRFCIDDVINEIADKMIKRHPHVFGDVKVTSAQEVLENWEVNKVKEKSRETLRDVLDAVPKQYPALMRAKKIVKKIRKNEKTAAEGMGASALRSPVECAADIADLIKKANSAGPRDRDRIAADIIYSAVLMSSDDADLEYEISQKTDMLIDNAAGKRVQETNNET